MKPASSRGCPRSTAGTRTAGPPPDPCKPQSPIPIRRQTHQHARKPAFRRRPTPVSIEEAPATTSDVATCNLGHPLAPPTSAAVSSSLPYVPFRRPHRHTAPNSQALPRGAPLRSLCHPSSWRPHHHALSNPSSRPHVPRSMGPRPSVARASVALRHLPEPPRLLHSLPPCRQLLLLHPSDAPLLHALPPGRQLHTLPSQVRAESRLRHPAVWPSLPRAANSQFQFDCMAH